MNTPTDKEVRDWYMGYGVEGRAELAEVEGNAFDRYLLERDAKVAKATEERIIKLLRKEAMHRKQISESIAMDEYMSSDDSESEWWASVVLDKFADALIKGEK